LNTTPKASPNKSLMKRLIQPIFRKLVPIGFVFFAVSAAAPAAPAELKGAGSNHDHHFDHDHRFDRDHFDHDRRYFRFPYWWYDRYLNDYAYDSGPANDFPYWQGLAIRVQAELARRGYYHGPINGVIDSSSRRAIRAFQKAQGLPETGLVDPRLLRSLKLPVP
jgi:hypothetical protein